MSDEPRHPSDTVKLDERELRAGVLRSMLENGQAEFCPFCGGDGIVSPHMAARGRLALPGASRERETLPELPDASDDDT